jgi:hypothetical protein
LIEIATNADISEMLNQFLGTFWELDSKIHLEKSFEKEQKTELVLISFLYLTVILK